MNAQGDVLDYAGNVHLDVFPRSALKPLQAIPFVEACQPQDLQKIALACASHHGESIHTDCAQQWCAELGLARDALECGTHWPTSKKAARALAAAGAEPTTFHNNCSGKHLGMLATALAKHWEPPRYIDHQHPVQQNINAVLEQLCEVNLQACPMGIDGCSIPTYAIPLGNLALGAAKFAGRSGVQEHRSSAMARIAAAMVAYPELVGGTDHLVSRLLAQLAPARVLLKNGAEGVYLVWLQERGQALALKCMDGSDRGANAALLLLLQKLELIDHATVQRELNLPMRNWQGVVVGSIEQGAA